VINNAIGDRRHRQLIHKSTSSKINGKTHIEFFLVHPFREGNGRLSRLLADVMAVQAGFQPLDYSCWDQDKSAYISAIQAGLSMNYQPMKGLVSRAVELN